MRGEGRRGRVGGGGKGGKGREGGCEGWEGVCVGGINECRDRVCGGVRVRREWRRAGPFRVPPPPPPLARPTPCPFRVPPPPCSSHPIKTCPRSPSPPSLTSSSHVRFGSCPPQRLSSHSPPSTHCGAGDRAPSPPPSEQGEGEGEGEGEEEEEKEEEEEEEEEAVAADAGIVAACLTVCMNSCLLATCRRSACSKVRPDWMRCTWASTKPYRPGWRGGEAGVCLQLIIIICPTPPSPALPA